MNMISNCPKAIIFRKVKWYFLEIIIWQKLEFLINATVSGNSI